MKIKDLTHTNNQNLQWFIDGKWYPIVIPDDIGSKTVKSWWVGMRDTVYIRTK